MGVASRIHNSGSPFLSMQSAKDVLDEAVSQAGDVAKLSREIGMAADKEYKRLNRMATGATEKIDGDVVLKVLAFLGRGNETETTPGNGHAVVKAHRGAPDRQGPTTLATLSPERSDALVKRLREEVTLRFHPRVACGSGVPVFEDEGSWTITLPRLFCQSILGFDPPPILGVSEADGDSMSPIFERGDLLLYELTNEVASAGIYVINYDGRAICKRVQLVGNTFRLIPENRMSGYVVETVRPKNGAWLNVDADYHMESFGIIGRVLWPNPGMARLHVQQVGELLRRMMAEGRD